MGVGNVWLISIIEISVNIVDLKNVLKWECEEKVGF